MNVFVCYPSEHQNTAVEVKNFVRSVGVECWYDKDVLVPGEDWDRARRAALTSADIVLILCASQLLERDGVYQREINEALQIVADKRPGSIFIIPFRVEDIDFHRSSQNITGSIILAPRGGGSSPRASCARSKASVRSCPPLSRSPPRSLTRVA